MEIELKDKTSYTFKLDEAGQKRLIAELKNGTYDLVEVPYTLVAADGVKCRICLYTSGKAVVQGKGAAEWVRFKFEPEILRAAVIDYQDVLNPKALQPHMGIDESGKGDFFGPLVIAAAYVDESIVPRFRELGVRDSKTVTSDKKIFRLAADIRKILGQRWTVVKIGPAAFNRLYGTFQNMNRLLAWGHARAIENLLAKVPGCPRALADQFGPKHRIKTALMQKGQTIELEQMTKAESDPAVAAASILAREGFVRALDQMSKELGLPIPKGVSAQVKASAIHLLRTKGPAALAVAAKCSFKTADEVLAAAGYSRNDLPEDARHAGKSAQAALAMQENEGKGEGG